MIRSFPALGAVALVVATASACSPAGSSSGDAAPGGGDAGLLVDLGAADLTPPPFESEPPRVYVAKVKQLLVGLPPSDEEVKAVEGDATALSGLIDGWMKLPGYQAKMLVFFQLAFQQTQITTADFVDLLPPLGLGAGRGVPLLVQNVRESFARTALALIAEGRPFTDVFTTHRLMMTPALMELYAFLDTYRLDDDAKVTDQWQLDNPGLQFQIEYLQGPIPLTDSVDPKSPSYLRFYDADLPGLLYADPRCKTDPVVVDVDAFALHQLLYGAVPRHQAGPKVQCPSRPGTSAGVQLAPSDFTTWKMVDVRPPAGVEAPTRFFDLPTMRAAAELVVRTPHPSFFSTPAFFANWPTNQSNQMRVTLNQALIVATSLSVDGNDPTDPPSTPGLDAAHAPPGSACFTCHRTLDPSRSILSSTYSWFYAPQTDPQWTAQKGLFAFQGQILPMTSIDDLAAALATHPAMPAAWAQKLCYYANSAPCAPDDPEFKRIVAAFTSAHYSWNTLVREVLASPITTIATRTLTWERNGEVIAVTRRDHLCAALSNRLQFPDLCGLDQVKKNGGQAAAAAIAQGLPSDGYGRGATIPVLPNQPTLFYRAGVEQICESAANLVIDAPPDPQAPDARAWSGAQPDAAIADFVAVVMGLPPSDPRAAPALQALSSHFRAARATAGINASFALKSTFTVACLAPSMVGIGM